MNDFVFNEGDVKEIEARGITTDKISEQIEIFKKGFPFCRLLRPCTIDDGITSLDEDDLERLGNVYSNAAFRGRAMKFVPASGAASRMFKVLSAIHNRSENLDKRDVISQAEKGDPDSQSLLEFMEWLKRFAFYEDLKNVMSRDERDIERTLSNGDYKTVLDYILSSKGLNLANLPKGLIPFHGYPGHSRTPFEEHIMEACVYTKNGNGIVKIHFTVSPEHERAIREHIEEVRGKYEKQGVRYEFGFSCQKPSTDTIAVDLENRPFRDRGGSLLFRPGGHGALLENLDDLPGDIIYIKNIDNVVPDRLKQETYIYKKALGGLLIGLQNTIFEYLERLTAGVEDEALNKEVFEFIKDRLSVAFPDERDRMKGFKIREYLISRLNRPLRVCGMVRNVSEPGGGPFWVEHDDKTASIQIVERSQVDMESEEQKSIFESATHFNPVDLVCGVRDYTGRVFDLRDYVDPNTGFISKKSKGGRELKALELPGLWNGSMAHWNSVFVEVPLITFNPVKTVFDLMRKEHQPE